MPTFYSSSTNQRDILPTPYARDPDASFNGSILYLNYPSAGSYTDMLAGNNQSQQSSINLPITNVMSQNSSIGARELVSWRDQRNEVMQMQTINRSLNGSDDIIRNPIDDPHLSCQNLNVPGGSLSLGTQIPVPSFSYRPANTEISILSSRQTDSSNGEDSSSNKDMYINSKFLKAAQELLYEFVNVRKALKSKENDGGSKSEAVPSNPQESTANSSSTLSPSERQDLQNKITKLLAMLDEVDRRYKQYYYRMQLVVASFDNIAGCGAAKPYTALALQTISWQFRCLRDAITGQIQSAQKSLWEEDSFSSKGCGLSRLRYIDQQIRQRRAMHNLGMQPQAWRPQRGLPENSVTILRAWLFEHFLHPYPKDSEKVMLARQTGLTRSQVANWFINARVRLWKPMIEDMYKEELCDAETDSNSSSENVLKGRNENKSFWDREDMQNSAAERSNTNQPNYDSSASSLLPEPSTNKRATRDNSSLVHDMIEHTNMGGRFMAYHQIAEFGAYANAGVSLSLGLQHSDGSVIGSDDQQNCFSMRGQEMYGGDPVLGARSVDYDCVNLMDSRQRFESSQTMHDFVA